MNHCFPLLRRALRFGLALATTGLLAAASEPSGPFRFTVTSDLHCAEALVGGVFTAVAAHPGGLGAFMVSVGDLADHAGQTPQPMRELFDRHFGPAAVWWPVVGNHDKKSPESMLWLRLEFADGHGQRPPLASRVARPGPPGAAETCYSWDYGNAHFVALNEYWDGQAKPGSDAATDGDIAPALLRWLEADLTANTRPFVFVFGHEPAFPRHRHVGDSLDQYPANRDAFWALLARHKVQAFICGHIHYYYQERHDGVVQVSDGAAGRDVPDYQTFLDVVVDTKDARIDVWQNDASGSPNWRVVDTIPLGSPPERQGSPAAAHAAAEQKALRPPEARP